MSQKKSMVTFNEYIDKDITVLVDLALGNSSAVAWGCDLTYDYVKINAEYTT